MKILFIGNSYTYFNDMPNKLFPEIAKACDIDITAEMIVHGDWYLDRFADAEDEMGREVHRALSENKFDKVILQEYSVIPACDPARFFDGARDLSNIVRKSGADILLYSTWARKDGHETYEATGWTHESMTYRLAASYKAISEEIGADVAYAGMAFRDVYVSHPEIELYNTNDLNHPSEKGSLLAAMTLFVKITGITDIPYLGILTESEENILREAAVKALRGAECIPVDYLSGSRGISRRTC